MSSPFELNDFDENEFAAPPHLIGTAADYGITDEEEEDDEDEEDDEEYVPAVASHRVSNNAPRVLSLNSVIVIPDDSQNCVEDEGNKRRRIEGGEASCSFAIDGSQGNEWNRTDIDGLFCPICMEAWTNNGEHHIWCNRNFLNPKLHFFTRLHCILIGYIYCKIVEYTWSVNIEQCGDVFDFFFFF